MSVLLLLDANAVLNAAFIAGSFSSSAVDRAFQAGHRFVVSAGVLREVGVNLTKYIATDDRRVLALQRVHTLLQAIGAQLTDDDDNSPSPAPKTDWHVFNAARGVGAAVLTADADLWLACRENGVQAWLPLELIRSLDGVLELGRVIFGVPPTPEAGALFVRAYPFFSAGGNAGRFTLMHYPGVYWLYYDAHETAWKARVQGLTQDLSASMPVKAQELQTVCLSWSQGKSPSIVLRAAGVDSPKQKSLQGPLPIRPSGPPSIGGVGANCHKWNGTIYACVSNDRPLSKDAWNQYLQHRELTPNPYDADRLARVLGAFST